jgi:hypothetical protein
MKGLCHNCFKTNVELQIYRGKITCGCHEKQDPVISTPKSPMLPFEDLPQSTPEERDRLLNQTMADLKEKWFADFMDRERLSETLIDRIHDT